MHIINAGHVSSLCVRAQVCAGGLSGLFKYLWMHTHINVFSLNNNLIWHASLIHVTDRH